jgi:hypothetical protein
MSTIALRDIDVKAHRPTFPTAVKSLLRSRRTASRGAILIAAKFRTNEQGPSALVHARTSLDHGQLYNKPGAQSNYKTQRICNAVDRFGAERPLLNWCCGKVPNQDGQGKSR